MANQTESTQEWWLAVRSIADLVNHEGLAPEEDRLIRDQLSERGFSADGIVKAMDWMDRAALSGSLLDTLSMLQPASSALRIDHAAERTSVHPRLLRALDNCRRRGWINQDLSERLIEGLRSMDSRDWDNHDIEAFLADVLGVSAPSLAGMSLATILGDKPQERYN